ncbi:MAG: zf-TFIIB domain-containing protein [Kofleriaceae bacterium]
MNCPRCSRSMSEVDRDGITIDRCNSCRGIWLDRGELEKLIARDSSPRDAQEDERPRYERRDDDDDDDRGRGRGRGSIWDIFD